MSTTAHFQVIHIARARTVSSVSWGWKRMPPFDGPRASLCCTRKPRKTCTRPSSRRTGMVKLYSRIGQRSRSRVAASRSRIAAALSNWDCAISNGFVPFTAMCSYPPLNQPLVHHRIGDLEKAGDVGAVDVVARRAEALRGLDTGLVDALHDEVEAVVHLLPGPAVAHAVLGHLETRGGDPAGVGGLARPIEDTGI